MSEIIASIAGHVADAISRSVSLGIWGETIREGYHVFDEVDRGIQFGIWNTLWGSINNTVEGYIDARHP